MRCPSPLVACDLWRLVGTCCAAVPPLHDSHEGAGTHSEEGTHHRFGSLLPSVAAVCALQCAQGCCTVCITAAAVPSALAGV